MKSIEIRKNRITKYSNLVAKIYLYMADLGIAPIELSTTSLQIDKKEWDNLKLLAKGYGYDLDEELFNHLMQKVKHINYSCS